MNKRTLLSLAPVALLSACGFRLRGVPEFGFGSLYIVAPASSPLARELQRTLSQIFDGRSLVVADLLQTQSGLAKKAQVILQPPTYVLESSARSD